MAKRKHEQGQPSGVRVRHIDTAPLLASGKDLRERPYTYANHATFAINPNEVYMDFYHLEPPPGDPGKIQALFVERVVIPLGLAKGFATGLANLIAGYEKALGVVVPNNREADPEDTINIWDEK